MTKHYDIKVVKNEARGKWGSILSNLVPSLSDALNKPGVHTTCPIHNGVNDFRLFKDYQQNGSAICSCGKYTDGFSLIQAINHCSLSEVISDVAQFLGINDEGLSTIKVRKTQVIAVSPEVKAKNVIATRKRLNTLWDKSLSHKDTGFSLATRYLQSRGLMGSHQSNVIRFSPFNNYYDTELKKVTGTYPAMLSQVQDANGAPICIHRTYLSADANKADVPMPKKLMQYAEDRTFKGSAIRLFPATSVLGVTEGVETALAVHEATKMPVWACIGNYILEQVSIPDSVELVVIWADKDRSGTGQLSADKLAKRLNDEGFQTIVMLPPGELGDAKGIDWLDVYNRYGCDPFFQDQVTTNACDDTPECLPSSNVEVYIYE